MRQSELRQFQHELEAALKTIRTLLDSTKNPLSPADVPHRYEDKFTLAEMLTRTAIAATLQGLNAIGLTPDILAELAGWAQDRTVTLRFTARLSCEFLREEIRQVESAKHVTETVSSRSTETVTQKVVSTVTDYLWSSEASWELLAFRGNAPEGGRRLATRTSRSELKTNAKITPRPTMVAHEKDLDLTWLLRQLDRERRASFAIDRTAPRCHTPRRNEPVDDAIRAFDGLKGWCTWVTYTLMKKFHHHGDTELGFRHFDSRGIFVPVVPVFEGNAKLDELAEQSLAYAPHLLDEQKRTLEACAAKLAEVFPRDTSVCNLTEAVLVTTLPHLGAVCARWTVAVDLIEEMLLSQLTAAIGKHVTPEDFSAYMEFHNRRLFKPEYQPQPFSHAVRRPEHDPEGTVSIQPGGRFGVTEPIRTMAVRGTAPHLMSFALDAATRVRLGGERHLHMWVAHQFSDSGPTALELVARARQFSSFILLAGRISSADTFEPKIGVVVQNTDLLRIPLALEHIPTPKEFRDAVESLSPEQRRFAKAVRGMQLESTLFAVCVIQIKPQLEMLLKLPPGSLTKEIKLTQDLMRLFTEFQIPSDLVSYDGLQDAPQTEKVARVTEHVEKMLRLLAEEKQRELRGVQERQAYRRAQASPAPSRHDVPANVDPALDDDTGEVMARDDGSDDAGEVVVAVVAAAPMADDGPSDRELRPRPVVAQSPRASPRPASAPEPAGNSETGRPSETQAGSFPRVGDSAAAGASSAPVPDDYTRIPAELDRNLEELDEESALRPTIIKLGEAWTRTSRESLLAEPRQSTVLPDEQKREQNKAFDLLDALSRSGALPIEHASLHVLIAASHRFDKTLIDTVIQGNVNPIEKVERSSVIVAMTVHRAPATSLLMEGQQERFLRLSRSPAAGAEDHEGSAESTRAGGPSDPRPA